MSDVLVSVNSVSKKYCRSLKRSLWYGLQDLAGEIIGGSGERELRADEFWAVKDVSFELKRGECLGLIGPNGAGKSTLLKMLNGLIKPDAGQINIRGRVSALIELGAGFNPILSGRENIYVNASVLGMSKKETEERMDEIVEFAEIREFIDTPVQNYSSGMKVRLGFAVASKLDPDILLIDEVLAVGDVGFRMKCFQHLLNLKQNGTSIVFVTHTMNDLSRVSQRSLVFDKGLAIFDGDVATAMGRYQNLLLSKHTNVTDENQTACIDSVLITDENGEGKNEFKTGDSIFAEITLKSKYVVINPRLIVAIESPSVGELGSVATPYNDFSFELTPPQVKIRLQLPNLQLLVGGYSISVSLYGPDIRDFFDRKLSVAQFQISGPPTDAFGYGVCGTVFFEHKWNKVN